MTQGIAFITDKINKKEPHVRQDDFYFDVADYNEDYDGFIHVVSTRDGSEIKIEIEKLLNLLPQEVLRKPIK